MTTVSSTTPGRPSTESRDQAATATVPSARSIAPSARPSTLPGSSRPVLARDRAELRAGLAALDRQANIARRGEGGPPAPDDAPTRAAAGHPRPTRAVVMTMGALHEGHASLLRAARAQADQVVATIYVNPLQFGAGEDLDRYPRTLAADLDVCAGEGVDLVFVPRAIHDPPPLVRLQAGPLGELLEGAARPGHFDGMLTLVGTMLHLVRPDLAFFGRKDAQQLVCIRRMVADLAFDVTVIGVETVREPDGLAMSSRNVYLTPDQRRSALALSRALAAGARAQAGGRDTVLATAREVLAAADGVDVDYLALASPDDLRPVRSGPALLLVAARVGTTRLIDNIDLVLPPESPAPAPTGTPASAGSPAVTPRPDRPADRDHPGA
ncbi:pantothenate synthetase [Frankia casuarinae]|uniref:Pantothenate synthetase n=2 Tax=Frankia casuarinae (strain DSM 45818 / CECT 9043 / HFP020203 / CcI3) TaxID=106370 RepID=Q2J4S1_FRACC|nr:MULTISPECIES: pantoate--beta-alanine ligase [Frankia]ABD13721.1 pantothenate synthetase [Frankia casuarinae]ETA02693.1 pantothenate synthetase [Frankia sp. CcI6]EYT93079.1 pantothenate synthetase [Frankia casuarinae]KDA44097.1 pantothenate synthetase [Frankia sp. BMG5.23]